MLEALEYYQSLAQKFPSRFLVTPGILILLAGLCIWLAGLRWRIIIGALAGAAICAAGVIFIGGSATTVLTASVIGLPAGMMINRITLGIFGAAAGAAVVMLILAVHSSSANNGTQQTNEITAADYLYPTWPEYEIESIPIDGPAAMEITVKSIGFYADRAKAAAASAGLVSFGGAAITAIIAIIAVLLAPRLFIAAVSSTLGTVIIFIGMLMLLFYKNSRPITYIADKPLFYATVLLAMIIFGTLVQLILSPSAIPVTEADKEKGAN